MIFGFTMISDILESVVPDGSSWKNIWYYSLRPYSFYGSTVLFQIMLFANFETDRGLTLCPKPLCIYFSSLNYKYLTNFKYTHKNFVFPTSPTSSQFFAAQGLVEVNIYFLMKHTEVWNSFYTFTWNCDCEAIFFLSWRYVP